MGGNSGTGLSDEVGRLRKSSVIRRCFSRDMKVLEEYDTRLSPGESVQVRGKASAKGRSLPGILRERQELPVARTE